MLLPLVGPQPRLGLEHPVANVTLGRPVGGRMLHLHVDAEAAGAAVFFAAEGADVLPAQLMDQNLVLLDGLGG